MVQIFQNLISNALKFRGRESPRIHIWGEQRAHEWIIGVKDNGIGIEKQHIDRIFQIFQRLHSQKDFPGTGIGLAVCKKIVEIHGGRIWLQSEKGLGTVFFFSLPAKVEAAPAMS
jgi:light-regulated signal transduction histidine kinase (bacteriophytochrome)